MRHSRYNKKLKDIPKDALLKIVQEKSDQLDREAKARMYRPDFNQKATV